MSEKCATSQVCFLRYVNYLRCCIFRHWWHLWTNS